MHEAQFHALSCFLTLTYDDEHLPRGGTLVKRHFQLFMKRLRKARKKTRIAYFHCGEYGGRLGRPHYHAIVFGADFGDKVLYEEDSDGNKLFTSEELDNLWTHGECKIGAVTFQSAAYVARYVMKKVTGDAAEQHYRQVDTETGEIIDLLPEYITMSLKPGIGLKWFEQYSTDVYPDDFVIADGQKAKPPAYYDRKLPPEQLAEIKRKREARALTPKVRANNTPQRLSDRKKVKEAAAQALKRKLE